ncbi:hypothetical protein [Streptomyces sp. NPDC001914]|uniref:hypothetical protein n=1 Tax=Streptomyces sp. NPDC001914 TaxID=3364623 RepID=UPI00367E464A
MRKVQGQMPHPGVAPKGTDETAVYRLSDDSGRLLYVGIGRNPMNRWAAHADLHAWWPQVAAFEVTWYDSRGEAGAEERRALRQDDPAYNIHGTPKWGGIVSGHVRAELAVRRPCVERLAEAEG